MDTTLALPGHLYLLAVDPGKQRLTGGRFLGQALAAASLADLELRGLIEDAGGRPELTGGAELTTDPVLDATLQPIAAGRARSWYDRIWDGADTSRRDVAARLAETGWVALQPRRALGLVNAETVVTLRRADVATLAHECTRVLTGDGPLEDEDVRLVTLAALAGLCGLRTLRGGRVRREARQRFGDLVDHAGVAVGALADLVEDDWAAAIREE